ncbi:acyl-CoA thioesterase [Parasphingorhabdus sp.]|uniref:acyl-CoA thioesterase n=1 Tax=Parasphingorhabdus sp. TaxID=2709688 RepID=UPI003A8C957A
MSFQTSTQVRFAHVDAAGIVFYPRYFEMLNGAVEDWFALALGSDFRTMHLERGIGVPSVQVEAEFMAPSMLGDVLTIHITPTRVGRSSCSYEALFSADGTDRMKANATLVCMDMASQKSTPWPDEIRLRMVDDIVPAN